MSGHRGRAGVDTVAAASGQAAKSASAPERGMPLRGAIQETCEPPEDDVPVITTEEIRDFIRSAQIEIGAERMTCRHSTDGHTLTLALLNDDGVLVDSRELRIDHLDVTPAKLRRMIAAMARLQVEQPVSAPADLLLVFSPI